MNIIPVKELSAESTTNLEFDLQALLGAIIEGGPDTVGMRFNVGSPHDYETTRAMLASQLTSLGCFVRPLRRLSDNLQSGFYFELFESEENELPFLLPAKAQHEPGYDLVNKLFLPAAEPSRAGKLVNWAKEKARTALGPKPILCGNIIVSFEQRTLIETVLLGTPEMITAMSGVLLGHASDKEVKLLSTGFLVDSPKPIKAELTAEMLAGLKRFKSGVSVEFKLADADLSWLADLQAEFELSRAGGLFGEDCGPLGGDFVRFFKKGEYQPEVRVTSDAEFHGSGAFNLYINKLESPLLIEFFLRVLKEVASRGGVTQRSCTMREAMSGFSSVYLPAFPLDTVSTVKVTIGGDLTDLRK